VGAAGAEAWGGAAVFGEVVDGLEGGQDHVEVAYGFFEAVAGEAGEFVVLVSLGF
jgi:hypothetical protein